MECDELDDVAAELALGALTGRERAEALAHLDRCEACRENVCRLMVAAEELLGLLPASEPPPGFEMRVMARIGLTVPCPAAGRRIRRVLHRRRNTDRQGGCGQTGSGRADGAVG